MEGVSVCWTYTRRWEGLPQTRAGESSSFSSPFSSLRCSDCDVSHAHLLPHSPRERSISLRFCLSCPSLFTHHYCFYSTTEESIRVVPRNLDLRGALAIRKGACGVLARVGVDGRAGCEGDIQFDEGPRIFIDDKIGIRWRSDCQDAFVECDSPTGKCDPDLGAGGFVFGDGCDAGDLVCSL